MPTYDYRCSACQHEFEEFQSISAEPLRVCPSCGETALKRLVAGGVGIIFKGSGFYVTDSKSAGGGSNGKRANGSQRDKATSEASGAEESGGGRAGSGKEASGGESAAKETAGSTGEGSPAKER